MVQSDLWRITNEDGTWTGESTGLSHFGEIADDSAVEIGAVVLTGNGAYDAKGIVQEAATAIKKGAPDCLVIADVCLCEYTDHGHCGFLVDGEVDNDTTLEILAKTALSHVQAGADILIVGGAITKAPDGEACPFGAHIRRNNPREDPSVLATPAAVLSVTCSIGIVVTTSAPSPEERRQPSAPSLTTTCSTPSLCRRLAIDGLKKVFPF